MKHHKSPCQTLKCPVTALYNIPTEIRAIACSHHKTPDMVDIRHKTCLECSTRPSFNFPNQKPPLYCSEHAPPGMINIEIQRCAYLDCPDEARYNHFGEKKRLFCVKHKEKGMTTLFKGGCGYKDCPRRGSFISEEDKNIKFCKKHSKEGMVSTNIKCIEPGCTKQPTYGLLGDKKASYCSGHAPKGMIDVKHKICSECSERAYFNYVGQKIPLLCNTHKKDDMINVHSKKCKEPGCTKQPIYNFPSEGLKIYCSTHALEGMIFLDSKKCKTKGCKEDATFGISGAKAHWCEKHRTSEMINIELENKCSIKDCEKEYENIFENNKFCNDHLPKDDKHLLYQKRICKYCDIREESDYICKECQRNGRRKEWSIVRHIKRSIDKIPFLHDSSSMFEGCSKRRPDIFFELPRHYVIIEIDENQHKSYDDSCECSRINEIINALATDKAVTFIRYNPDSVRNNKKLLNFTQSEKIDLLMKTINEELVKDHENFNVNIIQLYYDDNCEEYMPTKREDITDKVAL